MSEEASEATTQAKLVEHLRQAAFASMALTDRQKAFCTDQNLTIHLRARKWNVADSLVILQESLQWRGENATLLETLKCTCCAEKPGSHVIEVVGKDKHRRPIIFIRSYLFPFSNQVPLYCTEHLVSACERALRLMDPDVETWLLMVDMDGFGSKDMNMAIFRDSVKILQVAYRGRLGKAVILNTSVLFQTFYKLLRPFIKAVTYAKTEFPGDLEKSFAENFDPDTAKRLLAHIRECKATSSREELAERLERLRMHVPNDPFYNTDENGHMRQLTPSTRVSSSSSSSSSTTEAPSKRDDEEVPVTV